MNPVWIALGAVAIALIPAFMSLNAAKKTKRTKDNGDGGITHASDTGDRDRFDSDTGSDAGGDGGGGD